MSARVPKVAPQMKRWKVVRGDMVQVMRGRSKGEKGKVVRVHRKKNTLIVEGLNLVKRHQRGNKEHKGGIFTKEAPIHYSAVRLIDASDGLPCKVRWGFLENGEKVRVSKRTGEIVPKPEDLGVRMRRKDGDMDTPAEAVRKVTYKPPAFLELKQQYLQREAADAW
eukprot:CAMPEP_0114625230 /NCGR_PEP_ID=MMETSP0168-20121206/11165_1 /TAXON_ID=95228 ORGANISM="Vannella sp., Strain DIVA3 517/6/12" /NCGR_SAMPLE_ID=MMETSP0168 /ASSEMBLY_ACC=CAM_ASM_000044 /LENGTH=165 /DNA_ID=CAMNT_0001836509 /DNA_START=16 /DNA_END=511 /DNA_ORIENTATION=-